MFAVKQERMEDPLTEFHAALDRYIRQSPEHRLLTDSIPRLREARGKLVLMRRYEDAAGLGADAGIPLIWNTQNGSAGTSLHTVRRKTAITLCGCRTVTSTAQRINGPLLWMA